MTQVNGLVFTVSVVDANNFTIGIDTTGYSTYTSGGTAQKELLYSPGGDGAWRFTQFGTLAIAVNGVDAPQEFDLSVGTQLVGAGRRAAGRHLRHHGARLRADGEDRQRRRSASSGRASTTPNLWGSLSPLRPTSRTCRTAATSPAWSAASMR